MPNPHEGERVLVLVIEPEMHEHRIAGVRKIRKMYIGSFVDFGNIFGNHRYLNVPMHYLIIKDEKGTTTRELPGCCYVVKDNEIQQIQNMPDRVIRANTKIEQVINSLERLPWRFPSLKDANSVPPILQEKS